MNSGMKAISPVATSAPTPTRIAVEGIAIDRKARFSAKAKDQRDPERPGAVRPDEGDHAVDECVHAGPPAAPCRCLAGSPRRCKRAGSWDCRKRGVNVFRGIPALRHRGDRQIVAARRAVAPGPDAGQRGASRRVDRDLAARPLQPLRRAGQGLPIALNTWSAFSVKSRGQRQARRRLDRIGELHRLDRAIASTRTGAAPVTIRTPFEAAWSCS